MGGGLISYRPSFHILAINKNTTQGKKEFHALVRLHALAVQYKYSLSTANEVVPKVPIGYPVVHII